MLVFTLELSDPDFWWKDKAPIEADRPILAWANSFFKWKPRIGEIFR